jgi:dihydropteroate synthase
MGDFVLKELITPNIESELEKIGFDIAYRAKASDKFRYKTLKIFDLTLPQANILKQTALTFGADCGVHREVLTSKIDKTDVILGGSFSQLKKICDKLKQQPFSLKILAENIESQLYKNERKTKLVGILNITPDSFSDGGKYFDSEEAIKQLNKLIEDGADVIDIGAESTKPGASTVSAQLQIERLRPIFKNLPKIPVSVDTRSSEVAKFVLDNGATIINDVSGMDFDSKIADVVANYNATLVIQHSTGDAGNIIQYDDVVEEVYLSLRKKAQIAQEKGVNNIILDVGIGFGKTRDDNFKLLNRIEEFYSLNLPLMLGISRKSFLGITNDDNNLKDSLSLALSYPLINKVDYLRVHNVKLHRQLLSWAI